MKFIIKTEILNAEGPIFGLAESKETKALYFYGTTGNGKIYLDASYELIKQYLLDKITLAEIFTQQCDNLILPPKISQSLLEKNALDFYGCGECLYSDCPDYANAINDIPEFLEEIAHCNFAHR